MTSHRRLVVTTPSDREIAMVRTFDAPRHLVFEAYTRPDLIRRWLGPRAWTMTVCEVDLRVGGAYRYVWRGPDGEELSMGGVFLELEPPARLVATEAFDQSWYPGEAVDTVDFAESDGVTTMTVTVRYDSRAARDAVLRTPMADGMGEGLDRLEELLAVGGVPRAGAEREVAARYRRRAEIFEGKVAAVLAEQWGNPSPCTEWRARDVVRHIVEMHGVMLRPLGRQLSAAPPVDDDPLAAFRAARADVEGVLADPALATADAPGPWGTMSVEQSIDAVVSLDMVLHGWDLAKATGQDPTIDPDEVARAWASPAPVDEAVLRSPGVLGPIVPVPTDAPLQDRFLGYLGRDPHWTVPTT